MGREAPAIFAGRLAMVSGHFGSYDRFGASWRAVDGRPVCVFTIHRIIPDGLLGSRVLGAERASGGTVATNPNGSRDPHFFSPYLWAAHLWDEQHSAVAPCAGGY